MEPWLAVLSALRRRPPPRSELKDGLRETVELVTGRAEVVAVLLRDSRRPRCALWPDRPRFWGTANGAMVCGGRVGKIKGIVNRSGKG